MATNLKGQYMIFIIVRYKEAPVVFVHQSPITHLLCLLISATSRPSELLINSEQQLLLFFFFFENKMVESGTKHEIVFEWTPMGVSCRTTEWNHHARSWLMLAFPARSLNIHTLAASLLARWLFTAWRAREGAESRSERREGLRRLVVLAHVGKNSSWPLKEVNWTQ